MLLHSYSFVLLLHVCPFSVLHFMNLLLYHREMSVAALQTPIADPIPWSSALHSGVQDTAPSLGANVQELCSYPDLSGSLIRLLSSLIPRLWARYEASYCHMGQYIDLIVCFWL